MRSRFHTEETVYAKGKSQGTIVKSRHERFMWERTCTWKRVIMQIMVDLLCLCKGFTLLESKGKGMKGFLVGINE